MSRLKDLEAQYRKRTISRRHFMEGALAIGVSATLASSLISQADAATPKKGGRLRIGRGHGSTTDVLDPGLSTNQFTMMQIYGTRNCLTEIDHTGKLVPELAEGWEVSDDAAQWRFKLRKDVEFHNGKTLDTADVIASIHHHTREGSKSAGKELVKAIKEVKADGKDTVVFTLEAGNADFPYVLADFHLPIMPANADGSVDWQSGTGTGAYILDEFDPGVRATFKRNPNHYMTDRGYIDTVEMLTITDVTARTSTTSLTPASSSSSSTALGGVCS